MIADNSDLRMLARRTCVTSSVKESWWDVEAEHLPGLCVPDQFVDLAMGVDVVGNDLLA